jgi:Ca-activated chloride channel family protein
MTAIRFGEPAFLWLLALPAALLALWVWRYGRRAADLRRLRIRRLVPVRERFRFAGDLSFWLFLVLALGALIVSLAQPQVPSAAPQRAGVDLVVLQDASASMRVADVAPDRWQRSMRFLRELGDALSWQQDRIAMTVFAHIAAPQVRLTRDPNTFFFFIDHLHDRPPFRLEDETTWDTNLELGIGWGMRLVDKDEEIHGRSSNARGFIMLSDGETWSGEVARAIAEARRKGIPLFAIGVGTLGGGRMPVVAAFADEGEADVPTVSRLDRAALQRIAAAGGGQYFELERDGDRYIANAIVSAVRRTAPPVAVSESAEDLYWWCIALSAALLALGLLFMRDAAELGLLLAVTAASAGLLLPLLG